MWRSWGVEPLLDIDARDAAQALEEGRQLSGRIFNYSEPGAADDGSRGQLALPDRRAPAASRLERLARRALRRAGFEPGDAVLLWSAAGCQRQAWHTDYDPAEVERAWLERDCPPPRACLVGVMPGTRLALEQGNVEVGPGHVLWFDGRLVHAGAAYAEANVRLHFYAATDRRLDARDRTFLV